MTTLSLENRTAVVTGGARGIGRAISLALAQDGANIVIPDLDIASANRTAAEITALGRKVLVKEVSVTNLEQMTALAAEINQALGGIHIVVNNAGITRDKLLLGMSEEEWDAVLTVNLKGVFVTTKAMLRYLLKQDYGRIVNVASSVARTGNKGQCNYSASKAGILGFTKSLAREVASRGITVNAIAPGFIDTEMTRKLPEEVRQMELKQIPLGRFGTPEDVAGVVRFLCSSAASYLTGHTFFVDGGLAM